MNRIKYISILFLLLLCFFLNACKTEDEKVNYKEIIPQEIEELLSDNSNYSCKLSGSDDINMILYKNKDECLIEINVEIGNYEHNFPDLFVDKNAFKSYVYYNKNIAKTWGLQGYGGTGHGNGLNHLYFIKQEYTDIGTMLNANNPFYLLELIEYDYDSLENIESNKYSLNGTLYYDSEWFGQTTINVVCYIVLDDKKIISIEIYADNEQFEESFNVKEPISIIYSFYNRGQTVVDVSNYDNFIQFEKRVPDF